MYSLITSGMTWSYSRITTFESCPYKFFLTYIKPHEQACMFFSDYGSFFHEILEKFYTGELKKEALVPYYLANFSSNVKGRAPNHTIFRNYFRQGLEYLRMAKLPADRILDVEKRVEFSVGKLPFIGFVDLILQDKDSDIIIKICDHKARALKPRSTRGRYTKSDAELDSYLRQLYLYSIPVKELYGRYPSCLMLNCYRSGELIQESFSVEALKKAKTWAANTVESIIATDHWSPRMDYYHCKYLCGVQEHCEYYTIQFGRYRSREGNTR